MKPLEGITSGSITVTGKATPLKSLARLVAYVVAGGLLFSTPAHAALLVRYTFDEATNGATNALNTGGSLGSAADGVFSGNATRTTSTPGGSTPAALDLNPNGGNDDTAATAGDVNGLDTLTAITVTTWFNVQSNRGLSYYVIGNDIGTTGNYGWQFFYVPVSGDASVMTLGLAIADVGHTEKNATANVSAPVNNWVFLATTWTGSAVQFYAGTPTSATSQVGTSVALSQIMGNNTLPMRVGANATGGADRIPDAFMDDFRVYNTALTLADLQTIQNENLPEPSSALLLLGLGGALTLVRARRDGGR